MISLDDPAPFLEDCKGRIGPIIGLDNIGFNKPRRAPATKDIWELNGIYQTQAETPRQVFKVLPLITTRLHEFWLSAQLAFIFSSGAHDLEWISLTVFEGSKSDELKNPLLRAEWAPANSPQRANHAQPHWHVYVKGESFLRRDRGLEESNFEQESTSLLEEEQPSQTPLTVFNVDKFHFAMASEWQESGRGSHLQAFEKEKVLKWIEGCLSYIVDQLEYIDG